MEILTYNFLFCHFVTIYSKIARQNLSVPISLSSHNLEKELVKKRNRKKKERFNIHKTSLSKIGGGTAWHACYNVHRDIYFPRRRGSYPGGFFYAHACGDKCVVAGIL